MRMRHVQVTEAAIIREALALSRHKTALLEHIADARRSRGDYNQVTRRAARRILKTRRHSTELSTATLRRLLEELIRVERAAEPVANELRALGERQDQYTDDLEYAFRCVDDGNLGLAREALEDILDAMSNVGEASEASA